MPSAVRAARCELDSDCFQPDVTHFAIGTISPGPATAEIEHADFVSYAKQRNWFCAVVRLYQEGRLANHVAEKRLGIM